MESKKYKNTWFADNVDNREWAEYADTEKKESLLPFHNIVLLRETLLATTDILTTNQLSCMGV